MALMPTGGGILAELTGISHPAWEMAAIILLGPVWVAMVHLVHARQGTAAGATLARLDVWFRWTAASTGNFTVSTCGHASFDTYLAAYAVTMESIHNLESVFLAPGDNRLRVSVLRDGMFKQLHFWRRYGVRVVIVRRHLVGLHPPDAIYRLRLEWRVFAQRFADSIYGFNAVLHIKLAEH